MKKIIPMFALMAGVISGCGSTDEKKGNPEIISLDQQTSKKEVMVKASPCTIEVQSNTPALQDIERNTASIHKYYNFCDSTVIIVGDNGGYGGPFLNIRPITELKGTERAEKDAAYAKYKKILQLK